MDFLNKNKIEILKKIIVENLTDLIKSDYVLLDTPNHGNIGDQLIYEGELIFLKENIKHTCLYSSNTDNINYSKIPEKATILLHGGGNFGDIYEKHQQLRLKIIQEFPNNPIIIFPQTVFYNNLSNLEKESVILNAHSNLYICVRDPKSYEVLNKYLSSSKLLLLPDMAFFIDLSRFHRSHFDEKILIMDRVDIENTNTVAELNLISILQEKGYRVYVKDWPTFYRTLDIRIYNLFNRIRSSILNVLSPNRNDTILKEHYLKMGINFMNKYDIVYTTRLHGLILAILLDKEVFLLDNNYGKLSSFYDAWLTDFNKVIRMDENVN